MILLGQNKIINKSMTSTLQDREKLFTSFAKLCP